jgi:hypothetical protein
MQVVAWNSHRIEDRIPKVMTLVKDLSETLTTVGQKQKYA